MGEKTVSPYKEVGLTGQAASGQPKKRKTIYEKLPTDKERDRISSKRKVWLFGNMNKRRNVKRTKSLS